MQKQFINNDELDMLTGICKFPRDSKSSNYFESFIQTVFLFLTYYQIQCEQKRKGKCNDPNDFNDFLIFFKLINKRDIRAHFARNNTFTKSMVESALEKLNDATFCSKSENHPFPAIKNQNTPKKY